MNCLRALHLMEPEHRRTMTPGIAAALQTHRSHCARCEAVWQEEQLVSAHVASSPMIEPPSGLEEALLGLPRALATGGPADTPSPDPQTRTSRPPRTVQPSDAPNAQPMTLGEWLRTFLVLLAIGTLAGLGSAPSNSNPAPDHSAMGSNETRAVATNVARVGTVDLTRSVDALAAAQPGAPAAPAIESTVAKQAADTPPPVAIALAPALVPTPSTDSSKVTADRDRSEKEAAGHEQQTGDRPTEAVPASQTPSRPALGRDPDLVVQPAAPGPDPEGAATPDPPSSPAVQLQRATIPIHVFADVGGAEIVGCRGCDGHLTQPDKDVALREGLILPPFQISVEDHTGQVLLERAFVPSGIELRAQLEVEGFAPFTVRIYVQSETWLPCANLDMTEQVAVAPMLSALRFPLVDVCPPRPRPESEDPPAVATPRGVEGERGTLPADPSDSSSKEGVSQP